tara:strand:+ start:7755 stop:9512 length:1758 start_codon:yes stop_codon:yes gene_type:complete
MLSLVFDIETDDIKATKIWCIVAQDSDSGKIYKFAPHQLESGLELLQSADRLIGHNILGFDIPVIKNLTGVDLSDKKTVDTLVLSRLLNPQREGGHSLEMWGYRLKQNKIEFSEFSEYTTEMLEYCVQDVKLNTRLYTFFKQGATKGFSSESFKLEHSIAPLLKEQEENGFEFDTIKAEKLLSTLYKRMSEVEEEVHKTFIPRVVREKIIPQYNKDNSLSKLGLNIDTRKKTRLLEHEIVMLEEGNEDIERVHSEPFNLGSRKQIGEYLIEFGWKPKKLTPTGQPVVDEKILSRLTDIPEANLIAEYLLLQKRIAQIESWIEAVEEDNRIRGFVIPNGTTTGRMAHRKPNTAQVPGVRSPYGKECRECWTVRKGYRLVGIDASGLELRMLAHYMRDEEFTKEIVHGDIHTRNKEAAGLESRNQAKTFIYALLYGAGNKKIGQVVGGNEADGKGLRERFFASQPKFKTLGTRVTKASLRGFIKGLDGRKIHIKSPHSALNFLLQGAGAIVMKRALVILNDTANKLKLDFKFVANVHDEWQVEVKEEDAKKFGELGQQAIIDAGIYYKMHCPLDGEYKIGGNWSETH